MEQFIFLTSLAAVVIAAIWWGATTLPGEKWQVLAVVPTAPADHAKGRRGMNLTYYGVISATAYSFAVIILLILATAAGISREVVALFTALLLAVCMPASSIVARVVEKKKNTLTVGGAVFVGTLAAPVLTGIINALLGNHLAATGGKTINVTVLLSAVSIAYAFGEGLGRLACLSFGCCYGKPLARCSPRVRKILGRFCIVFHGKTKKIAYASGLDGQRVLPVQIITAALYSACGLIGTALFLNGHFGAALAETLVITQVWRITSEFFRADFRGDFTVTPYQIMAAVTVLYALCIAFFFPPLSSTKMPQLSMGLSALWSPGTLLAVQAIWVISFLFTGKSSVTGARIAFYVQEDKI